MTRELFLQVIKEHIKYIDSLPYWHKEKNRYLKTHRNIKRKPSKFRK